MNRGQTGQPLRSSIKGSGPDGEPHQQTGTNGRPKSLRETAMLLVYYNPLLLTRKMRFDWGAVNYTKRWYEQVGFQPQWATDCKRKGTIRHQTDGKYTFLILLQKNDLKCVPQTGLAKRSH
jgi:hypothetical protein